MTNEAEQLDPAELDPAELDRQRRQREQQRLAIPWHARRRKAKIGNKRLKDKRRRDG